MKICVDVIVRCSDVVMGYAALRQDATVNPALSWTGNFALRFSRKNYCMQLVDTGTWAL